MPPVLDVPPAPPDVLMPHYDAGKVAPHRTELDFEDLESDYGIGVRVGTRNGVSMRFDVAVGSGEGAKYLLRFDNVF